MTAGAGSAAATTRAPRKRVKKPRPTALAPLSAPRNQREDGLSVARVPLEAVFVSRFRRVLLRHITLSGWDPTDADLALLTAGRDGFHARVEALTLDDCAHVTLHGLRAALPVLQHATVLRLRRCAGLSSELPALLPLSLVEVDLSYCEWLDDSAVRVLARRCLALRRVSVAHCRRLTDYGVSAFADVAVSSLTHLDLSRLPRVTDTCLLALLLRCTKLQWLDASRLSGVEGLTLQGLPRNSAPALATLHVAHNTHMHFLTLAHLVRTLHYGALTDVDASHCAQLTDETLVALGRYAPALVALRLAFCTQVTDAGMARLVEFQPLANDQLADFLADDAARPRCTKLTTLDLTGCHQITSDGLVAVARQCHALETLMVDGLRRLDARGLHALATNCSRLAVLHWGGILIQSGPGSDAGFFSVPSVDHAAAQALRACRSLHTLAVGATACDVAALADVLLPVLGPQLRDLDASGIATDVLLRSVAAHCTQLRTLRLSRSRYFSHAAFLAVAMHCRQLRTLELESCEQLRDEALVTLARHGGASLQTLVVSNDWQLTDAGITALAQRCPRLRRLAVRHCPEVSPLCLRGIAVSANAFVIATRDGLEPKPAAVTAFLTLENELEVAARRLTRWWRDCLGARTHSTSAIDRALRHVRRRRRCVVRIQRCVRRWLGRLRALRLVAHAQRERQRTCDAHWLWLVAYTRVGRLLRRYCRQWRVEQHDRAFRLAEREHERRDHAAREIQRVYWGWRGRSRARQRRHEVIQWRQRRLAGACCLQRVWRGMCGRTVAHAQALACWRRLLTTADAKARQHAAALHLTRAVRGFLGRYHTRRRRIDRDAMRLRRVAAARTIQRGARAYLVRVLFRRRRARGATQMQRVVRGFLGRHHARRVILMHAYAAAPILLLLNHRSIFTRDLAVMWKTKRDAGERLAIACQCVYRGYFYGRLQRRQRLAQRRQLAFERDAGARTLQHFFRSLLIVGRLAVLTFTLHLRRHSATKVQSVWRMWLGKVRATAVALRLERTRRHAATLQQLATASPSSDRRRRLLQFGAVHVLVVSYRRSLARRGWQAPSVVRFRHTCAATIQSLVRGVQTRQRVARFRELLTWAARLVQRVWRGRLGRKQWRARITEYRLALRRQQEEDRAMRIASKRTGQFVIEAQLKHERHARVLQQWIRTLQRRQLFKQARDAQDAARRKQATQKLASVLTRATESVVFQARVWHECVDCKQQLNELDEPDVVAMEREVAALKRACLDEYVAHAAAAAQRQSLAKRKRDSTTTKKRLLTSAANVKQTIQPFAEQAKQLTLASARVHFANRQLQDELRVLQRGVAAFHVALQAALPLDPLLYERDVEALVARLGLPVGRVAILDQEAGEAEAN